MRKRVFKGLIAVVIIFSLCLARAPQKVSAASSDSVWSQVSDELVDYAKDLVWAVADTFAPSDLFEFGISVLDNKEAVKALLSSDFLDAINDPETKASLLEIAESCAQSDLTSYGLESAANLIRESIKKQPDLCGVLLNVTLSNTPRIALHFLSKGTAGKILPIALVLNTFKASASRFWGLGEALAELQNVSIMQYESIENIYNNMNNWHLNRLMAIVNMAKGNSNKEKGEELVDLCNSQLEDDKRLLTETVNGILTPSFKFFHPNLTKRISQRNNEFQKLDGGYFELYSQIYDTTWNKSQNPVAAWALTHWDDIARDENGDPQYFEEGIVASPYGRSASFVLYSYLHGWRIPADRILIGRYGLIGNIKIRLREAGVSFYEMPCTNINGKLGCMGAAPGDVLYSSSHVALVVHVLDDGTLVAVQSNPMLGPNRVSPDGRTWDGTYSFDSYPNIKVLHVTDVKKDW